MSAIAERISADRRYARANGYGCKAGATGERPVVDRRYSFGNGYAGKAGTSVERAAADRRYACGDGYAGKAGATGERVVADRRYAIGERYAGKAGTSVERAVADSCYACADGYAGKAGATVERIFADSCYACGNGYGGNVGVWVGEGSSECVAVGGISTVSYFRYGKVWAVCVGAVIGGYNDIAGCRSSADSVGGVAVDCRKAESCRAGGVEGALFFMRGIIFTCYLFYAVRCFGCGGYGCMCGVPVMRVGVYVYVPHSGVL